LAVDAHVARAADAVLAADVRSGQTQPLAQKIDQGGPRRDLFADGASVHYEGDIEARLSTPRSCRARCQLRHDALAMAYVC